MTQAPQFSLGEEVAGNVPAEIWVLVTGIESQVWMQFPESGTLWVYYAIAAQPAVAVFVWHEGGSQETVPLGTSTYTINAGDCLVYQLTDVTQSIKLGWGYM
jgi:hypothetical protein